MLSPLLLIVEPRCAVPSLSQLHKTDRDYNLSPWTIAQPLEAHGYGCFWLDERGELRPVDSVMTSNNSRVAYADG